MRKKVTILFLILFLMPILMGFTMSDPTPNLPPIANVTLNYYQPKFISVVVVSNNSANTTDITAQIQALQLSMKPQNVVLEYQIMTSAVLASSLTQNLINYRCYASKYFLYYPGDTTCITPIIQNFLYTEGFTMQAICSSSQYSSINSGGFFSGNGGGGYYTTSTAFKNYLQTKEANPLIAAGSQGTLYNPLMVNTSSFIPTCTITDQDGSNLTVTYVIKDSSNNVKFTGTKNIAATSSLQSVAFPVVSLTGLVAGKYTVTFNTYSNPAINPITSDPKYTTTTNIFYNAHGSNNLVTDYIESYNTSSSDPADYNLMANRWMVTQDSSIFTPNQGSIPNNGVFINNPSSLNKSGNYSITYQVQDQPITQTDFPSTYSLFGNFNLWSTSTNQYSSKVVNRPMALGTATLSAIDGSHNSVAITDSSYDFDHQNDSGKGIALVSYRWKQQGTLPWINGIPASVQTGLVYEVQMQSLSVDGIWSFPYQLLINAKNPPVAQFTVTNNPMTKGGANPITDTSYSPNVGSTITQRNWYILDTNYNILQNNGTTQPNLSTLASGDYIIEEIVKDNGGLVSVPCYQNLSVIDSLTLTASLSPNPAKRGQRITISTTTDGFAKNLSFSFPLEITSLDTKTVFPITKNILVEAHHVDSIEYNLPLGTPDTIDKDGNRLRPPYVITVVATNDDQNKSVNLQLDVTGNIFDGIETELK